MNDKQFEDAFTAVGGWFIVSQYDTITKSRLDQKKLLQKLFEKKFDSKIEGTRTRLSSFNRICRAGRIKEALKKIRDSKRINRVHPEAKLIAEGILTILGVNSKKSVDGDWKPTVKSLDEPKQKVIIKGNQKKLSNDNNFDQLKKEFGDWLDEYDVLSTQNSIASYKSYVNQLRNGYNEDFGVGKFETIVSVYQSKSENDILKFYTKIVHFINDQKRIQKKKWTDIGSGFYQFDDFLRDKFDCDDLESGKVSEITYKKIEPVTKKTKPENIPEKESKVVSGDISEEFTQKELMRTFKSRLKTQSRYYPNIDMLFPARLINDIFHKNKDNAFDTWMQNGLANMRVLSKNATFLFSFVRKICLLQNKRIIVVLNDGYKFELYTYKGDGKTRAPLRTLDKRDISVDHIISLAEIMQQNKNSLPAFKEMTEKFHEYEKFSKVRLNPRADRTWKDNLLQKYSKLNSDKMRSAIMVDLKRMNLQYILMDQRENSKKGKN